MNIGRVCVEETADTNPFQARDYLELQIDLLKKHGLDEDANLLQIKIAESFVAQADNSSTAMDECGFLERAIQAYRRSSGNQEIILLLQKRISSKQKSIPSELGNISTEIDITEAVNSAKESVRGKSLFEALKSFSILIDINSYDQLKSFVFDMAESAPLLHTIGWSKVDDQGRTISKVEGVGIDGVDAEYNEMIYQYFTKFIDFDVRAKIIPALITIKEEHEITERFIAQLVAYSPLVPQGYGQFFIRGLLAGFYGDFPLASILMVPQLEECFRNLLRIAGEATAPLDGKGIQNEMMLNSLLDNQKLKEIITEDVAFTLRALLIEKNGYNYRHDLAHGLITYDGYFTSPSVYIWWLIFRLTIIPYINLQHEQEKQSSAPENPE